MKIVVISMAVLFFGVAHVKAEDYVPSSEPAYAAAQTSAAKAKPAPAKPLTPAEKAIKSLEEGNARYAAGKPAHPRAAKETRKALLQGQHPFATVLSCSDSRVPVEIIFDQGIGDIFVVRDAGNVVDDTVTGTVEYGVEHLGTPLLVVMGHTKCGAVTAAVKGDEAPGKIPALLGKIKPSVNKVNACYPYLKTDEKVQAAVVANVERSAAALLSESGIIKEKAELGALKILGAVYDMETGKANLYELPEETLRPAAEERAPSRK